MVEKKATMVLFFIAFLTLCSFSRASGYDRYACIDYLFLFISNVMLYF